MTEEQNQQLTNDQFILNSIDSVEKVTEELSELSINKSNTTDQCIRLEHIENTDSEEEIKTSCSAMDELEHDIKVLSNEEQEEINEIKEVLNSIIADNKLDNTNDKNDNSDIDDQNITLTAGIISDKKKNPKKKNYKKRFYKKSKKPSKQASDSISSEKETINHDKIHPPSENNKKIHITESFNKEDHRNADNVEESKSKSNKKRYGKFNHNKRISYLIPTDAIPIVLSNNFNNHHRNYPDDNYRSFPPKYIRVPYESALEVRSNYSYKNNYNLTGNSSTQRKDIEKKYDDNIKQKKYYHKQQYKYFPIRINDSYYNHNPFPRYYNSKKPKENNIENKPDIGDSENKELIAVKKVDETTETEELATIING